MAEEKKSDSKKPEAKKDEQNWAIVYFPILVILFLLALGSRMAGLTIFGQPISNPEQDVIASKRDIFNIYEWIGIGRISPDIKVINTKKTTVRNEPGGNIIGVQKKLQTGFVRGLPVERYGTFWLQVDYPNAPDGWITISSISSKVGIVRAFNIIPITYNAYKPIGYILLIILLIIYLYFRILLKREENIWEKKRQLYDEQFKEKEIPLATRIEAKPDVEEISGFQTEEIMPVEELEKQNRWQHIQDLIKSYNPSDWRQAIIEADIILEEMLDKMGYDGVTIGDKLKNVERSDFITLDKAWSAHKIRNQIAHDGSNFKLTRELAEKTIKEFEEVFKEFYYI